jgi:hypothetical protein
MVKFRINIRAIPINVFLVFRARQSISGSEVRRIARGLELQELHQ